MVDDPADYLWPSYRANAFGIEVKLVSPQDLYLALGGTPGQRQQHLEVCFLISYRLL
jgi:hypothetical protein